MLFREHTEENYRTNVINLLKANFNCINEKGSSLIAAALKTSSAMKLTVDF